MENKKNTNDVSKYDASNISEYDFLLNSNKNHMNYTALSFEGREKIKYEELHEKIDEYARALYKKGIREKEKVGILFENTPEAVYTYYALGRLGATRVGLNLYNNHYKMQRDFDLLKPQRIIAVDSMYKGIKDPCDALNISPILYAADDFEKNMHADHYENLHDIIRLGKDGELKPGVFNSQNITDILFTGGSSGFHKGVALNQGGLNGTIQNLNKIFALEPGMIHLGNIPFGQMVFGRFAMHYSFCNNLEYALTRNALPDKFLDELIRTQANGAMGGPVHWNALQNNPLLKKGCISNLIQAGTGGEKLKGADEKADNDALNYGGSSARLINMLGLTEMYGLTHACIPGKNVPGTIGLATPGVKDLIIDPEIAEEAKNAKAGTRFPLKEVEAGKIGILLTRGPGMMLEYYNNEIETNKVFIYDEFGTKWYNTGDLACRVGKNNQEVAFTGRAKRSFVCGYENIYPEQIEELIATLPEIKEVLVTEVPDPNYQYLPVYHIQLSSKDINLEELKNKMDTLMLNTLGYFSLPGYIIYSYDPLLKSDRGKFDQVELRKKAIQMHENNNLKLVRKMY